MLSLTYWEFALGLVTFLSLALNIFQLVKRRGYRDHAIGSYSQLWDIIVEIDAGRVTEVAELKRLINQARIQLIALNNSIGTHERVIRPWNFGIRARRREHEEDVAWKKRSAALQTELDALEEKKASLVQELEAGAPSAEKGNP